MKVMVLSDSLALCRQREPIVTYTESWPQVVGKLHTVLHVGIGHATTRDLLRQVEYYDFSELDHVFVQIGLNDICPRLFYKFEIELYRRLGFLGKLLIRGSRRFENRMKRLNKRYLSNRELQENLLKLNGLHPRVSFLTLDVNAALRTDLPHLKENVLKLNEMLRRFNHVELEEHHEFLGLDGCHYNPAGHSFVARKVMEHLNAGK